MVGRCLLTLLTVYSCPFFRYSSGNINLCNLRDLVGITLGLHIRDSGIDSRRNLESQVFSAMCLEFGRALGLESTTLNECDQWHHYQCEKILIEKRKLFAKERHSNAVIPTKMWRGCLSFTTNNSRLKINF